MGVANIPKQPTETTDLHGRPIDSYLVECVMIDPIAIDEEFIRVPSDLAYWNECYAEAIREALLTKREVDHITAQVMIETRENLAGTKATVDDVKARVTVDARVQEAEMDAIEAEATKQQARLRCEAVLAKRDMLQSLGAKLRAEMSDPIVREQCRAARPHSG